MDTDKGIENLRQQYIELCLSYRATDTFRTTLLGLLPFGSVVGGVLILVNEKKVPEQYLPWIVGSLGPLSRLAFIFTKCMGY